MLNKEAGKLVLQAALEAEAEKFGLDRAALGLSIPPSVPSTV